MIADWLLIAVGLLLTAGTGLFVAAEFALVNLDRNDLQVRADRGEKGLGLTIRALRITSTHLSGAQLGITLTTLLTGYTMEPAISRLLDTPLTAIGLPEEGVRIIGSVVGVGVATVFSMVVGELAPKNFALALPLATAKAVLGFQTAFTTVFKPLIVLFNATANAVIRAFGIEPREELSGARTAEELSTLVRRSAQKGALDADHAALLTRTLRFAKHSAEDVMTPRVRMATVAAGATAADVLALAVRTGHSRFPVLGRDSDDIRGIVHVKQAFVLPAAERVNVTAADLAVEPFRVPRSMGVDTLLGLLRAEGFQIAVVTDEYGGTDGLVTLEDLVEELVGDVRDEHDRTRAGIVSDGEDLLIDAALRPDELLEKTGIEVPTTGEYETIGGFVIDELDRLPEVGDAVDVPQGQLRVERLVGHRIDRLRFRPVDRDE